ncbi:hypothetical protein CsatB_014793 [Cannabis sativa]
MGVQTRRGVVDPTNPQVVDPALQNPGNVRVPPTMNPKQPTAVGQGVTTPLSGIAPSVQETGNNSSAPNQGIPNTVVLLVTNVRTTIGDYTEIQNLRAALGIMQGHTNTLHHDQEELHSAVNIAFEEQRHMFAEWRDKEMEMLRAQQAAIDNRTRQAIVLIRKAYQATSQHPTTVIPLGETDEDPTVNTSQTIR